jgi:sulfoxide reductase heme-binding subunit YedZ
MSPSRAGYGFIGLIILIFILITIFALSGSSPTTMLQLVVRLSALYGFVLIAIAAIMTPFLLKVGKTFGRPFVRVHHTFATLGIILLTLHPLSYAILVMTPAVFIPSFQSWIDFWTNGGRVGLIFLYIAVLGSLLRTRWTQWRYAHALMYLVLLVAIVHANLIGSDFVNPGIRWIYNVIFAAVMAAFILNVGRKWRSIKLDPAQSAGRIPPGQDLPATWWGIVNQNK